MITRLIITACMIIGLTAQSSYAMQEQSPQAKHQAPRAKYGLFKIEETRRYGPIKLQRGLGLQQIIIANDEEDDQSIRAQVGNIAYTIVHSEPIAWAIEMGLTAGAIMAVTALTFRTFGF